MSKFCHGTLNKRHHVNRSTTTKPPYVAISHASAEQTATPVATAHPMGVPYEISTSFRHTYGLGQWGPCADQHSLVAVCYLAGMPHRCQALVDHIFFTMHSQHQPHTMASQLTHPQP